MPKAMRAGSVRAPPPAPLGSGCVRTPQPPPLHPRGMPPTGSIPFTVISLPYLLFLHLPPPLLGRDRLPRFHGNPPPLPSLLQRGFHPFLSKIAIFSPGFPFSPSPPFSLSSRFPRRAAPTGAAAAPSTHGSRSITRAAADLAGARAASVPARVRGPDPDSSLHLCSIPLGGVEILRYKGNASVLQESPGSILDPHRSRAGSSGTTTGAASPVIPSPREAMGIFPFLQSQKGQSPR